MLLAPTASAHVTRAFTSGSVCASGGAAAATPRLSVATGGSRHWTLTRGATGSRRRWKARRFSSVSECCKAQEGSPNLDGVEGGGGQNDLPAVGKL